MNDDFKKKASLESLGASSDDILDAVKNLAIKFAPSTVTNIFDVGCGQGTLLGMLNRAFPQSSLYGCDYSDFDPTSKKPFHFFTHDCNKEFPPLAAKFDIITSSEVIEHLENGRHFWRQLAANLTTGGIAVVSTPNIESITSVLSFMLRGYHSAFGGRCYPAHITPVGTFDMKNMIQEAGLTLLALYFIPNGRMPGINAKWSVVTGGLSHRFVSDNYVVVALKK